MQKTQFHSRKLPKEKCMENERRNDTSGVKEE